MPVQLLVLVRKLVKHGTTLRRAKHFPTFIEEDAARPTTPRVQFADVGCGFGGLLVRLSVLYPDTLMLGMELRDKVRHCK